MKAASDKSVTITLGKPPNKPFIELKQFDIVKHTELFKGTGRYSIVTTDTKSIHIDGGHSVSISMRHLNLSKWSLVRKIELKILRKAFKTT